MSFDNIIQSIASSFHEDKNKFLYISLPRKMMESIPSLIDDLSFNVINLSKDYTPLKPFMRILSECKPTEELIEQNSYPLQTETLKEYLFVGITKERKDFVNHEEIHFEKEKICKTVSTLLKKLCDKIYIIQNAQELSIEAIEILKQIETYDFNGKFLFCFDIEKTENISPKLKAFINEKRKQNNFYEITNYDTFSDNELAERYIPDYEILLASLRNCRLLFALDQGMSLSKWITNNFDSLKLSKSQKRYMYFEMAIISYFSNDTDEASFLFNIVLEHQEYEDEEFIVLALLYMSKVLLLKNAIVSALKYIMLAMKKLENKKDSDLYALAFMIHYEIMERTEPDLAPIRYKETQELLKKRDLLNNKTNSSFIMPWCLVDDEKQRKNLLPRVEESIEFALKIGNKFALSTAYHWKGMLVSHESDTDKTLEWYNKCNEIRTEIGDIASIIKIRNGLSYEYLIRSGYKKSFDLINSFLNRITEINDYPEIIITLNNIAKTLFYSRHFDTAYELFQKVLYLMRLFNLEDATYYSFLPEYNDVSAYKAIVNFIRDEDIHAKITFHNILTNGKLIAPSVEPLISFMYSIMSVKENKIKEAEKYFSDCKEKFINLGTSNLHSLCFACYEFAHILTKNNHTELAKKYIDLGFKYAKKQNFEYYLNDENKLSLNDYIKKTEVYDELNINLEKLGQNAEKEQLIIQLHKKLRDSQFLNRIMSFGSKKLSEKSYIKNVIQATFDHTMAEAVYIAEKNIDEWKILDYISRSEGKEPTYDDWENLYNESTMTDKGNLFLDKKRNVIFGNISKYDFVGAVIIVQSQNSILNSDDFDIINIAISNLQAHIVMIKQNEHLLYISSTDQLSMLKNRRALQEQLSIQSEMIRRYNNKRSAYFQLTIIFLDMDNFKFYNDTYGHETGDLLIAKFGELLKRVFRKVDFISRFGGDEFVILLPNTNCIEAKRAAERVHEALEKDHFFIPDLEDLLERSLDVPEDKILGFSTGICSNFDIDDPTNMEETMANADQALYFSKKSSKGSITMWSEIKDKLPQNNDTPKRRRR